MYEQNATGWAKHLDFIILDMICLEVSMVLAYVLRHGWYGPFQNISYRNLGILLLFLDFALLFISGHVENVLQARYLSGMCVYTPPCGSPASDAQRISVCGAGRCGLFQNDNFFHVRHLLFPELPDKDWLEKAGPSEDRK